MSKELNKELLDSLKGFKEIMESEMLTVTEKGIERTATVQDKMDCIVDLWGGIESVLLDEYGIDLDSLENKEV